MAGQESGDGPSQSLTGRASGRGRPGDVGGNDAMARHIDEGRRRGVDQPGEAGCPIEGEHEIADRLTGEGLHGRGLVEDLVEDLDRAGLPEHQEGGQPGGDEGEKSGWSQGAPGPADGVHRIAQNLTKGAWDYLHDRGYRNPQ